MKNYESYAFGVEIGPKEVKFNFYDYLGSGEACAILTFSLKDKSGDEVYEFLDEILTPENFLEDIGFPKYKMEDKIELLSCIEENKKRVNKFLDKAMVEFARKKGSIEIEFI